MKTYELETNKGQFKVWLDPSKIMAIRNFNNGYSNIFTEYAAYRTVINYPDSAAFETSLSFEVAIATAS